MKIDSNLKVQGTPPASAQAIRAHAKKDDTVGKGPRGPQVDSVEISAEGRARAASVPLSPERVTALRQRILEGAYYQTDVVDAVARNILKSGGP